MYVAIKIGRVMAPNQILVAQTIGSRSWSRRERCFSFEEKDVFRSTKTDDWPVDLTPTAHFPASFTGVLADYPLRKFPTPGFRSASTITRTVAAICNDLLDLPQWRIDSVVASVQIGKRPIRLSPSMAKPGFSYLAAASNSTCVSCLY